MQDLFQKLESAAGKGKVLAGEPMSRHVTFRTGGNADYYVIVSGREALKKLLKLVNQEKIPYYIIGNGSNLLFPDEGYRGVVLQIGRYENDLRVEGNRIYAGCGVYLSQIAKAALEAGLTGMEFAAGIPGTLGGAIVMNAGAYGGEMKDILQDVTVMDKNGGESVMTAEQLELSYRHSVLPERELVATEACILLEPGKPEEIRTKMEELGAKRREKQPLEYPSAGSTFKRPEGYFAGKLIQDAGLKGMSVGGAQVSEKHSGFIINKDHATTADILSLVKKVQDEVSKQFGVSLEMEVKVVK